MTSPPRSAALTPRAFTPPCESASLAPLLLTPILLRRPLQVGVRVEVLALSADGGHEPREVEQFHGEGRIAARGFRHPHYVAGQLFLMDDDVIGFLWLPIGTFVVFSRVPEEEEPTSEAVNAAAALGLRAPDFDEEDA